MLKKCKNCGGKISFSPKSKGNMCESCASVFPIPYNYQFNKKPFSASAVLNTKEDELANSLKSAKCSSCGANIMFNKLKIRSTCPYCSSPTLVEGKKRKMMYIDSIIPFTFGKADAVNKFKSTMNKKFYVNKKVFKNINQENVHGAYVNAFVFDMVTQTIYKGVFSYTSTTTDSDGRTHTKTYYKNVEGIFDKAYKNITVEANSNLDQAELHSILPFQYDSAVDFQDDFLSSHMLEYQDKMFNDCVDVVNNIMASDIKRSLLAKHNCDRIESITLDTNYLDRTYNYCLLPVYFMSEIYKDKKYKAVMNGQTAKVGKLPTDKLRVFFTVLLVCLGIVGVLLFTIFLT